MPLKPKLLLTGGAGMVGRNLREHPLAASWDLRAPTRSQLDLGDYRAVRAWMLEERPDVVVHAAGRVGGIQANLAHPVEFLVDNVDLGRNVIMAAREAGVPRLLNLASSCMYPREAPNPLHEDLVLKGGLEPTNEGYALAKIYATRLCDYVSREQPGLQYKTMIPCNLYGRHDKFDPAYSHLLPAIIHKIHLALANGVGEVEIWGDGSARREFMYAGDLADAVIRGVGDFDGLPALMNVGIGHDHSINEYYQAVATVIGWKGRFVHDLDRPVGMKQKLLSVDRQREWGWEAPTPLLEGIRRTYAYYLEECAA